MKISLSQTIIFQVAILLGFGLLAAGCHDDRGAGALSPSSEDGFQALSKPGKGGGKDNGGNSGNDGGSGSSSALKPVPRLKDVTNQCVGYYSKFIHKKDGGDLQNCSYYYNIPPRGLQSSMEMFITIVGDDSVISADFGPSQSFNKAVLIEIPYDNADLTGIEVQNLTIAWYDETSGQWIDVGGNVDQSRKVVWTHVNHFTRYTLSAD